MSRKTVQSGREGELVIQKPRRQLPFGSREQIKSELPRVPHTSLVDKARTSE